MSSHAATDSWVERAEATLASGRAQARRRAPRGGGLLDSQQCALTAVEIEDALRGGRVSAR